MKIIPKEKYLEARDIITKYERQSNESLIEEFCCVVCGERLPRYKTSDLDMTDAINQDKHNFDGGTVCKISPGYGSAFDCFTFFVALCDECIEKKVRDRAIKSVREIRDKLNQKILM